MKAIKILFSGIVLLWLVIQVIGCIPPPGYYGHHRYYYYHHYDHYDGGHYHRR